MPSERGGGENTHVLATKPGNRQTRSRPVISTTTRRVRGSGNRTDRWSRESTGWSAGDRARASGRLHAAADGTDLKTQKQPQPPARQHRGAQNADGERERVRRVNQAGHRERSRRLS